MKYPVSFLVVEATLAPILDAEEEVCSEIASVDGKNQEQVREVVRKYIVPYFVSFDDRSKKVIANSILYFACAKQLPDTTPLDALPTPFELEQNITDFCNLLLDELKISSSEFCLEDCEYSDDLSLVHRLRRLKTNS